jgi:ribosomal protein S18 acetylase RimI-like enzyme
VAVQGRQAGDARDSAGWGGLAPARQLGKGAGRRLAEALFEHFKESGVQTVHTTISWNDPHLVDYFRSLGFSRGEFVHLQKSLS